MKFLTLIVILLVLSVILPGEESPFEDFIIAVFPENDGPGIKVVYTGTVKDSYLPFNLEILIPHESESGVFAGNRKPPVTLEPVDIIEVDSEKWIRETIVTQMFELQVIFNPFSGEALRKVTFDIRFNVSVTTLHLAVQHPLAAEDFEFEESVESFFDGYGIQYSRVQVGPLPAGGTKTVSFSYRNPTGILSKDILEERLQSLGTQEKPNPATEKKVIRYKLPLYAPLIVLAVLSIIIGWLYWRSVRSEPIQNTGNKNSKICAKCNTLIKSDDHYCSKCGRKV
tara:strand:+ start:8799 stop:9647 length:849 start_codon:yes stop_codon:yes gene_type:complete